MNTPINLAVDFSSPSHHGHCDVVLTVEAQSTKRKFFRVAVDRRELQKAIEGSSSTVSTNDVTTNLAAKLIR